MLEKLESNKKLNILIFGESNVGKSSLFNSYCNLNLLDIKNFNDIIIKSTESIDLFIKIIENDNKLYNVEFLEFGGYSILNDLIIFLKIKLENLYKIDKNNTIDAIIFIFDSDDYRTFRLYKKYIVWVFNNLIKFYQKNENNTNILNLYINKILKIPLLFIGTKFENIINKNKTSLLNLKNKSDIIESVFVEFLKKLKKDFNNNNGDNLFFIKSDDINYFNELMNNYLINLFNIKYNKQKNSNNKFENIIKNCNIKQSNFLPKNYNENMLLNILKNFIKKKFK